MQHPWLPKGFGRFDESKHKRDHGKFSSTGGSGAKPDPRHNPDLDAAMGAPPATPKPAAPLRHNPDLDAAFNPQTPAPESAAGPQRSRQPRQSNAKKLESAATAAAKRHLQFAAANEKAGDVEAARRYRAAAHGYHRAAGHHANGEHDKAEAVKRVAEEYANGTRQLSPQATPPASPASPQSSQDKPQAPILTSGGPKAAPIYQSRTPARIHGTNGQASSNGQAKPSPGTAPPASGPPPLPHQRTAAAAQQHGNNLARAIRSGDQGAIATHRAAFEAALKEHEAAGHAAIERMVREKHGSGIKAQSAMRKAKAAFGAKLDAARQRLGSLSMTGKGLGVGPWIAKGVRLTLADLDPLPVARPWVAKGHDVSGEARDESGQWTAGSASAHKDNYRALLAQAKDARKAAHAHAMSGARESQAASHKAQDDLSEAHRQLQWDSDEHDAYNELDELVVSYDPDASLSERMDYFKDVTTAAQAAMKEELSFDDADEAETKKITAENHAYLKTILQHAKAAREHLRRHAAARREAASIKSGDWLEKCIQRLIAKSARPWLVKMRDRTGHEHASDGRFGSGGGTATTTSKPTANGLDRKAETKAHALAARIGEVPAQLRTQVTSFVRGRFRRLEKRYGRKGAFAILGAAVLLLPMPVPGSSLIPVAMAEVMLAMRRAISKAHEAMPDDATVKHEARKLVRELYAACGEKWKD